MADSKLLKAVKTTIHDFSTLAPSELVGRLRDPELIKKMKKLGVNDAQIHRIILILQENKPDSKELLAVVNRHIVRHAKSALVRLSFRSDGRPATL